MSKKKLLKSQFLSHSLSIFTTRSHNSPSNFSNWQMSYCTANADTSLPLKKKNVPWCMNLNGFRSYHAIWFPYTCFLCDRTQMSIKIRIIKLTTLKTCFKLEPKWWRRVRCTPHDDWPHHKEEYNLKTKQLMPYHWICRWHAMFVLLFFCFIHRSRNISCLYAVRF